MTEGIYKSLECSVCLDVFRDPRILPCGHTFCLECLQKHCRSEPSTYRVCSLCRSAWQVPISRDLDDLPKNFAVNSVLSTLQHSKTKDAATSTELPPQQQQGSISTPSSRRQPSSKLKACFAFSVSQVIETDFRKLHVDILSVKRRKVLFGSRQSSSCSLHVFDLHKDAPNITRTFPVMSEYRLIGLHDATWTSKGRIVCAARSREEDHAITVLLKQGRASSRSSDLHPFFSKHAAAFGFHWCFELRSLGCHAFSSNMILLDASWQEMLEPWKSELELDGSMMIMTMVFVQDTMWRCLRVIRTVSSDDSFDYWTLELRRCLMAYRLCKYTANKQTKDPTLNEEIVSSNIASSVKLDDTHEIDCASLGIELSARSALAYDEAVGVFLADYKNDAVHLFSTDGQYLGKILSQVNGLKGPCSLGVNTADGQLIVGQREGEVRVYYLGLGLARRLFRKYRLKLLPYVGTVRKYVDHVRNNI